MPRGRKADENGVLKFGVALPDPLAKLVDAEAERKGTTRKAVVIERMWESYKNRPDDIRTLTPTAS